MKSSSSSKADSAAINDFANYVSRQPRQQVAGQDPSMQEGQTLKFSLSASGDTLEVWLNSSVA